MAVLRGEKILLLAAYSVKVKLRGGFINFIGLGARPGTLVKYGVGAIRAERELILWLRSC